MTTTTEHHAYLAGPMRGIRRFNFDSFATATAALREHPEIAEVFSPAERDLEVGFDPSDMDGTEDLAEHGFSLRAALGIDLEYITSTATCIIVLPGWRTSAGARAEVATAEALGVPIWRVHGFMVAGAHAAPVTLEGRFMHDDSNRSGHLTLPVVGVWRARDAEHHLTVNVVERTDLGNEEVRRSLGDLRTGRSVSDVLTEGARRTIEAPGPGHVRSSETNSPPVPELVNLWGDAVRSGKTAEPVDGEERVVSETGGAKGRKLAEMGAIDPVARLELAKVAGMGSRKYSRGNYMNGVAQSLFLDALHRHVLEYEMGVRTDHESGLHPMAHAAWQCLALVTNDLRGIGTDDRMAAYEADHG